jgi:very-short-patch-repair endonuclease
LIIFSPVVSEGMTDGALNFLRRTGNLFNVAITRARAILIVVGDMRACHNSGVAHYKGFLEYVNKLKEITPSSDQPVVTDFGSKYPTLQTNVFVSEWEKLFYQMLYKEGIVTVPQYQVDQYSLDLALFESNRKLNIEIDGEKYHRNWDGELLKRDRLRNKRLIELGWDVQRFWVYEIRDNLNKCIHKIKDWKG